MYNYGIAIHGGAGTISKSLMSEEKEKTYVEALTKARDAGYAILRGGGSSIDAVVASVSSLEDCPLFNAGKGAVFNAEGSHELDASIMSGKALDAGAVAAVQGVKNPIQLAKLVMVHSDHILLMGEGALKFAKPYNVAMENAEYFHDDHRFNQWQRMKGSDDFQLDHSDKPKQYLGTVGAVALDSHGDLAAATSTGGMTNKKFGRIGDSPIIGAGTYANNNTCAISCTGSGEYLMKGVTAYDISCMMEYGGMSLYDASHQSINTHLLKLGGDGGVVGIDRKGNIVMPFNCEGMYRASKNRNASNVLIYKV